MNVLSLFDGIGVTRQALKELNKKVDLYVASEIDPYASFVCERNHSDVIQVGDVTKLSDKDIAVDFDLVVAGSPCQGFSRQGLQKGVNDPRSALIHEFFRLKKYAKYFLLENVYMNQAAEDFISETLGVEPLRINSSLFVPQSRPRLYWTNIPNIPEPTQQEYTIPFLHSGEFPATARKGPPRTIVKTDIFKCLTATYHKGIRADGRPGISSVEGLLDENKDFFRMLSPTECEFLQGLPNQYTLGISNTQRYKALGNAFTCPVIKHLLTPL